MSEYKTPSFVGQEKELRCLWCKETTTHYLYHSGDWICTECGNSLVIADE